MLVNPDVLGDPIEDVEEELFLLYSRRSGFKLPEEDPLNEIVVSDTQHGSALGLVDQRHDSVRLQFSYQDELDDKPDSLGGGGKKKKRVNKAVKASVKTLEVELAQNITALRTRVGDTGGGVWRGSVLLAQVLLKQLHGPNSSLFDTSSLSTCNTLELGAGTGLLGLILNTSFKTYMCTDLPDLIPLITKNIHLNPHLATPSLKATPLDWCTIQQCPPSSRDRVFPRAIGLQPSTEGGDIDLILAVDCVYNSALVPPLLTTIDHYASPGKTWAMVVMELRDEEVVREFLMGWTGQEGWTIWPLGNEGHSSLLDDRFAIWMGQKGHKEVNSL